MLKNRYKPIYVDLESGKWHTTNEVTDSNLKCLRVRVRSASSSWYVKHWRRTTKLYFQILDNTNSEIIPQGIQIIDINTVRIDFADEIAGTLNLIFKETDFYNILPSPTVTPTNTATPTATATITPTSTATVTPTNTVTPTQTVGVTSAATPTVTPTNTATPTVTATVTPTVTPSVPSGPDEAIIWEGVTVYGTSDNGTTPVSDAYIRLIDPAGKDGFAQVATSDFEGTDAFRTTYYPWLIYSPAGSGDFWGRVRVDANDFGNAPVITHNSITYNAGDEIQLTHDMRVRQDGTRLESWLDTTQNVWYIDICADSGGSPDGEWVERRVELMTTHSGATMDMIWWRGGTVNSHHESTNPQPRIEFFGDASGGDPGTTNYVYNTLEGDRFGPWWRDAGPYTQGRFETWVTWGPGNDDYLDVVIKDFQGNTIPYDTDFELVGANIYLDFTGEPIGTEKTADLWIITMDNTDSWSETSKRVVLYGKKLAADITPTPSPTGNLTPTPTATVTPTTTATPVVTPTPTVSPGAASPAFVTTWTTALDGDSITLPSILSGSYNYSVDWGDGSPVDNITTWDSGDRIHTYTLAGTYDVEITGIFTEVQMSALNVDTRNRLVGIKNWGSTGFTSLSYAFADCGNLTSITATDGGSNVNDSFAGVDNMEFMFNNLGIINPPDVHDWDVSSVTTMESMFNGCLDMIAGPNCSTWNLGSMDVLWSMFEDCSSMVTPPDVSTWDTSTVTDMDSMFQNCTVMTPAPDVSNWNVEIVNYFDEMFSGNSALVNLDIKSWNPLNTDGPGFLGGVNTAFTVDQYDELLISWSQLASPLNASGWSFGTHQYSTNGAAARASLLYDHDWTIDDGGHIDE